MKKIAILLPAILLTSLLLLQCKRNGGSDITPEIDLSPSQPIDKDKVAVQIMDTLTSRLTGRWNLARVEFDIRHQTPAGSVKKDTTFLDFATLNIQSVSREEDPRYPLCKGEISYGGNNWPVIFKLMAGSERIFQNKGPQAITLLDWNFSSSHEWQAEEVFFRDLTLIGDNYTILLHPDGSMTWKGLNRDVKEILLQKL